MPTRKVFYLVAWLSMVSLFDTHGGLVNAQLGTAPDSFRGYDFSELSPVPSPSVASSDPVKVEAGADTGPQPVVEDGNDDNFSSPNPDKSATSSDVMQRLQKFRSQAETLRKDRLQLTGEDVHPSSSPNEQQHTPVPSPGTARAGRVVAEASLGSAPAPTPTPTPTQSPSPAIGPAAPSPADLRQGPLASQYLEIGPGFLRPKMVGEQGRGIPSQITTDRTKDQLTREAHHEEGAWKKHNVDKLLKNEPYDPRSLVKSTNSTSRPTPPDQSNANSQPAMSEMRLPPGGATALKEAQLGEDIERKAQSAVDEIQSKISPPAGPEKNLLKRANELPPGSSVLNPTGYQFAGDESARYMKEVIDRAWGPMVARLVNEELAEKNKLNLRDKAALDSFMHAPPSPVSQVGQGNPQISWFPSKSNPIVPRPSSTESGLPLAQHQNPLPPTVTHGGLSSLHRELATPDIELYESDERSTKRNPGQHTSASVGEQREQMKEEQEALRRRERHDMLKLKEGMRHQSVQISLRDKERSLSEQYNLHRALERQARKRLSTTTKRLNSLEKKDEVERRARAASLEYIPSPRSQVAAHPPGTPPTFGEHDSLLRESEKLLASTLQNERPANNAGPGVAQAIRRNSPTNHLRHEMSTILSNQLRWVADDSEDKSADQQQRWIKEMNDKKQIFRDKQYEKEHEELKKHKEFQELEKKKREEEKEDHQRNLQQIEDGIGIDNAEDIGNDAKLTALYAAGMVKFMAKEYPIPFNVPGEPVYPNTPGNDVPIQKPKPSFFGRLGGGPFSDSKSPNHPLWEDSPPAAWEAAQNEVKGIARATVPYVSPPKPT